MYLMWQDSDRKKQAHVKIEEAAERFLEKYGHRPAVVLVHPDEQVGEVGLRVVARANVHKGQYWVGDDLPVEVTAAVA